MSTINLIAPKKVSVDIEKIDLDVLFDTILSLSNQYQSKDDVMTLEKFIHDDEIDKKIDKLVLKLGREIKRRTSANVNVPIKYKQLYNIYTKTIQLPL
jgi:hypothetical protein